VSRRCFNAFVSSPRFETAVRRQLERFNRGLAEEVTRLREDAGLSRRAVARAAGVNDAFLGRVEEGTEHPSPETLIRLGLALGADLRAHLYPNTGPMVRDRHQARILEALLGSLDARWRPFTEAAVRKPGRGWIDAVLHDPRDRVAVATEIESMLRRLEQLVRWHGEKAASLPSWDGWVRLGEEPRIGQLLIVRHTRANRSTVADFRQQLRVAYPAHPDDALAALTGTSTWPGNAMAWTVIEGARTRLVGRR
jgi:transcriptional regulator with XRE-family HTH domain